jgi:hypothetical protein
MKVEQEIRALESLRSFQRGRCSSGSRRGAAWAKSAFITTASTG